MARLAALLIAFWAGSLWTVCGLVAPSLFRLLDDRRLAGQLAATFFNALTWIGVTIAALLLAMSLAGRLPLLNRVLVLATAGFPLASRLLLGPLMEQARAAGDMTRFGILHGIAGGCFLIACLSAAMLVWKFNRPAG